MPYRVFSLILLVFLCVHAQAAIFCPQDKTISCYDDIHALSLTGMPTLIGYPQELARYSDQGPNGICNAGIINRTWYIDVNQNNQLDSGEHACVQKITVQYIGVPVTVNFPPDRQYSCVEDIRLEHPEWTSGACDMVGVSRQDQVFNVSADACYKILRTFTVINWCTYLPGTSGWNGQGIWTHTQVIKVVEESKPVIATCAPVVISTDAGCEGTFTIRNSADDPGKCGRQSLLWTAEIDLWSDGIIDYNYGFNQPGQFRLDSVANKKEVVITLPGKVRMGTHKVNWKVRDLCGNNTSCTQYVQMDNCTQPVFLRYSFSKDVNDTIRVINCANAGFQYYTLYVTDLMGNQGYAEVYLLAFDNGSCNQTLTLTGTVTESGGAALPEVQFVLSHPDKATEVKTSSNAAGKFDWQKIGLYKEMQVSVESPVVVSSPLWHERVNLLDLKLLQDHVLGLRTLQNFEWVAADVDGDQSVRARDVGELKHRILHPSEQVRQRRFFVDTDTVSNGEALKTLTSVVTLGASDGTLDYRAVLVGDISGANQAKVAPRNKAFCKLTIEGDWAHVILEEDIDMEGVQMTLQLPEGVVPTTVNSEAFGQQQLAYCHDPKEQVLRGILQGRNACRKGSRVMSVRFQDELQLQPAIIAEESGILLPGYRYLGLRGEAGTTVNSQVMVSPNPGPGVFTLNDSSAKVLSVTDGTGRQVNWQQTGQMLQLDAATGIYIALLATDSGQKTIRIIVAR
ncbi:MAG: T9SS type A sorting domain-containing protein [Saprospiraceae bacterium]|nr:T9SS type A sorting domain-containing protein [Saprospiraceae bacterium]